MEEDKLKYHAVGLEETIRSLRLQLRQALGRACEAERNARIAEAELAAVLAYCGRDHPIQQVLSQSIATKGSTQTYMPRKLTFDEAAATSGRQKPRPTSKAPAALAREAAVSPRKVAAARAMRHRDEVFSPSTTSGSGAGGGSPGLEASTAASVEVTVHSGVAESVVPV